MSEFNYSALSAAYRCNLLYKYLYIDKLKPDTGPNVDLVFGSSMHFALEEYFLGQPDVMQTFNAYWKPESKKLEYGRFSEQQLVNMAEIFLSRFVRLHAKKIHVGSLETKFFRDYKDVRLFGTPDIIGKYNDIPSIIDFKTSSYPYDKESIQINDQMYLYSYLVEPKYIPEQLVYIIFIKGLEPRIQTLTHKIDKNIREKVLDNIYTQCKNLDRCSKEGTWTYNSKSCIQGTRKCEFFDKCWKNK